ncbi:multidrug resistance efflux transporter family protein [Deinococcus sp. Marseille-Q6407]|uniref:multidrug resistance efflux transporter family protein n=1 Tax=Deinococcus sp. Marseille-Q6407 TaxID=2969223 RepID=UPI0021C0C30F|nr:multidrug resistance efflux transporter family protein [Deinococcus sp. Marseille-Q6407]
MLRLLGLGLLASAFFSSTYVLNEQMSAQGGHWFWSASLRYLFVLLLLSVMLLVQGGPALLRGLWQEFRRHAPFWVLAGSLGFGAFYALLCFSSAYASAWVVAATFQFTVVASLIVLAAFGQPFSRGVIFSALLVFAGVCLTNLGQPHGASGQTLGESLLYGALPALLAAFCYPAGNQLVWQAARPGPAAGTPGARSWAARVPYIRTPLLKNTFGRIWLMTLGSMPLWGVLGLLHPVLPQGGQVVRVSTALVALLSGVIATGLFLYARDEARTPGEIATVDATQASEVIFALLGGVLLLGSPLPGPLAWAGLVTILVGLVLFTRAGR